VHARAAGDLISSSSSTAGVLEAARSVATSLRSLTTSCASSCLWSWLDAARASAGICASTPEVREPGRHRPGRGAGSRERTPLAHSSAARGRGAGVRRETAVALAPPPLLLPPV